MNSLNQLIHQPLIIEDDVTRDQLTNLMLLIWCTVGSIGYLLTLIRAMEMGWTVKDFIFVVIIITMLSAYSIRYKISSQHKALLLIFVNFVIGITGLYNFGMLAGGAFFFPLAAVLVSLFYSQKIIFSFIVVSVITVLTIGMAYSSGYIQLDHSTNFLITSYSHWSVYSICLFFFFAITCLITIKYRIAMSQLLQEREQEKKELYIINDRLGSAQRLGKLGHYVFDIKNDNWTNSSALDDILGTDNNQTKNFQSWLSILHSDHLKMMSAYFQDNILKNHQKFNKKYKIVDNKTGQTKWIHGLGELKFDKNNNPIEMFGTIQDITDQIKVEEEREKLIKELKKALKEVKTLSGLIPICASCKKIRDDKGYWNVLESYIQKKSNAQFSHSMCPECSDKLYGTEDWFIDMKKDKNKK